MITPNVTGSTGAGNVAGAGSSDPAALDRLGQIGQDTFLKLMVAQLQNQDPMNPTDSSQFLAQTAQFTSVEKLTQVASQTADALTLQQEFGASSLIGKTVLYSTGDGSQADGTVDSVRFTDTGPVLGIGTAEVPFTDVLGVSA